MFFSWIENTLVLHILWNGWAKHEWFGKVVEDKIKLSVKIAPEHGKATEYMLKWLAKNFGVPQKNVTIKKWATSPYKIFHILSPQKIPQELHKYWLTKKQYIF